MFAPAAGRPVYALVRTSAALYTKLLTCRQISPYLLEMARRESVSKVTVLLQSSEFKRFEAYCRARGFKKSTLIARLIREHLDAERFAQQDNLPFAKGGTNGD